MAGGRTRPPARRCAHPVQSSHQEPLCLAAAARQSAASAGLLSAVSYQGFGPGGLTMPATWPPLERTYRTSPPSSLVAWYDVDQGTMWSLTAPTTYVSFFTSDSDNCWPASSISPLASSLRMYRQRR